MKREEDDIIEVVIFRMQEDKEEDDEGEGEEMKIGERDDEDIFSEA